MKKIIFTLLMMPVFSFGQKEIRLIKSSGSFVNSSIIAIGDFILIDTLSKKRYEYSYACGCYMEVFKPKYPIIIDTVESVNTVVNGRIYKDFFFNKKLVKYIEKSKNQYILFNINREILHVIDVELIGGDYEGELYAVKKIDYKNSPYITTLIIDKAKVLIDLPHETLTFKINH